jgi:microcystin-dependent protein/archaellum component FlaC
MHRILTFLSLSLLLACEKPALHALEDRIAALEGSGSDDTGGEVSAVIEGLSSNVEDLDTTVSDLSSTVDTLGTDLDTTNEALSALEDQVTTLDEETTAALETLSESLGTLSDDVESLDSQMEDVLALLEDHEDAITSLEESEEAHDDAITALEDAVASLEDQSAAAAGTVVGLMSETIPDAYLPCDGSSVLQADYPDLYAVIGEQFGSEDSLSFNLPDLRGEFLRGMDDGAGNDLGAEDREDRGDGTTGDAVGTWQDEDIGSASYSISTDTATTSTGCTAWSGDCNSVLSSASLSISEEEGAEVRPRNISVVWVIKY